MKSSYQHTLVVLLIALFEFGWVCSWSQPESFKHHYYGLNFSLSKSKDPQELLRWLNNSGYPYAQIELDTMNIKENSGEFHWNVSAGSFVSLDTLSTNNLFNKKTLQRCINYQLGQPYNSAKIENIQSTLGQISFIKPNPKVLLSLQSETFGLHIQCERKKNNAISALVALQPKPNSTQSILTGNIDLELHNALKQAESIEFHWKRPQPQSQNLSFKFGCPFTAGLPVGFQFEFSSFLRDSTFSSTDLSFRLLTKMNDLNGFSAAIRKSTNTNFRLSSDYGNTRLNSYSLRFAQFHPETNSFNFYVEGSAGNRFIQYESTATTKKMFGVVGKAWSEIKWNKFLFTRINAEFSGLFSDSLYNNEISRLGGMKNLRAFIEESIYASQYAMVNSDFGIYVSEEVQAFVFGDLAYIKRPTPQTYYDTGIGIRFQQENGSVGISYGVGNIENNGLQLKNGRIGINFSSRF